MKSAICRAVRQQPGIHFRQLQRDVDCSVNTLNYHLRRADAITAEQIRGYRRCYPVDVDDNLYSPLAALNHDPRGKIVYAVNENRGITGTELGEIVDIAASTLSSHLRVLEGADIILVDKNGRKKQFHTEPAVSQVVTEYGKKLLDQAADNFIGLWE